MSNSYTTVATRVLLVQKILVYPMLLIYASALIFEAGLMQVAAGAAIVCFCILPVGFALFFMRKSQQLILDPNFPPPSLLGDQNILDDLPLRD